MVAKLLAGSIRRFSGYTANPPAEIYAGTSSQIENRPQFWDIPIAVGHMSAIVIGSAQEIANPRFLPVVRGMFTGYHQNQQSNAAFSN